MQDLGLVRRGASAASLSRNASDALLGGSSHSTSEDGARESDPGESCHDSLLSNMSTKPRMSCMVYAVLFARWHLQCVICQEQV